MAHYLYMEIGVIISGSGEPLKVSVCDSNATRVLEWDASSGTGSER